MRHAVIMLLVLWLGCSSLTVQAIDLSLIDRSIIKEPKYTAEPYYALLAFGPKAEKRVWLVVDGDVLYVDRNGNGDLTEANERVAAGVKENQDEGMFKGTNTFEIGEVAGLRLRLKYSMWNKNFVPKTEEEKKVFKEYQTKGWNFATLEYPFSKETLIHALNSSTSGSLWDYGEDSDMQVLFCRRPADAQICYFDGPLTFSNRGMIDTLQRDSEKTTFRTEIGTLGLPPRGSEDPVFNAIANWDVPDNLHPVADFEFAHKDATQPPIKLHVVLDQRCCGSLFYGPVHVPTEAATGKAKVTVSFPNWKKGNVTPATFEVRIEEASAVPDKK